MEAELSLQDLVKNLRNLFGDITMKYLDLTDDPDDDVSSSLASLADSSEGGLLIVKFDTNDNEAEFPDEDDEDGGDDEDDDEDDDYVEEDEEEDADDEDCDDEEEDADDADDEDCDDDEEESVEDDDTGGGDDEDDEEDDESPFEAYRAFFPILESRIAEVEEGRIWVALVAGSAGAPGHTAASAAPLRAGELSPVLGASLSDLQLSLIGIRWQPSAPEEARRDLLSQMARMGIVTERDGEVYPTVAGMIALGHHPHSFIPGMRVELNLEGKEQHWRGSLLSLAEKARSVVAPCLQPAPQEFRDILLNAILHRDWRIGCRNTPIRITVSGGNLEATNPGLLASDWRVGKSSPPNPALHALACALKLARGRGAGLQRIDTRLIAQHLRPLELSSEHGEVRLLVPWPKPVARPVRAPAVAELQPKASTAMWRSVPPRVEARPTVMEPRARVASEPHTDRTLQTPARNTIVAMPAPVVAAAPVFAPAPAPVFAPAWAPAPGRAPAPAPIPAPTQAWVPGPARVPSVQSSPAAPVMVPQVQIPERTAVPAPAQKATATSTPARVESASSDLTRRSSTAAVTASRPTSASPVNPSPAKLPPAAVRHPRKPGTSAGSSPEARPNQSSGPASAPPAPPVSRVSATPTEKSAAAPGAGVTATRPNTPSSTATPTLPARPLDRTSSEQPARAAGASSSAAPGAKDRSTQAGPTTATGRNDGARVAHPPSAATSQPLSFALGLAADSSGEKEKALLRLLRDRGPSTARDLMKGLDCKRWTIRSILERLMATGVVRASAASAKSPNQKYELVR